MIYHNLIFFNNDPSQNPNNDSYDSTEKAHQLILQEQNWNNEDTVRNQWRTDKNKMQVQQKYAIDHTYKIKKNKKNAT